MPRRAAVEEYLADRRRERAAQLLTLQDDDARFISSVKQHSGLEPTRREPPGCLASQAHAFAHEATRLQHLTLRLREELAATADELEHTRQELSTQREHQCAMAAEFLRERRRAQAERLLMEESVARHRLIAIEAQLWARLAGAFAAHCAVALYHTSDEVSVRSQRFLNDLRSLYDEIGHQRAASTLATASASVADSQCPPCEQRGMSPARRVAADVDARRFGGGDHVDLSAALRVQRATNRGGGTTGISDLERRCAHHNESGASSCSTVGRTSSSGPRPHSARAHPAPTPHARGGIAADYQTLRRAMAGLAMGDTEAARRAF